MLSKGLLWEKEAEWKPHRNTTRMRLARRNENSIMLSPLYFNLLTVKAAEKPIHIRKGLGPRPVAVKGAVFPILLAYQYINGKSS